MTEDGEFRLIYAGQGQTTPGAPGQPGGGRGRTAWRDALGAAAGPRHT